MTKLDEAIGFLRNLSPARGPARGEDVAALVFKLVEDSNGFDYTPEEMKRLDLSEAAAVHGDFAMDEQVRAIWAKHGL